MLGKLLDAMFEETKGSFSFGITGSSNFSKQLKARDAEYTLNYITKKPILLQLLALAFFFFASALYSSGRDMTPRAKILLHKLRMIAQIKAIGCTCDAFNVLAYSSCDEMADKLKVLQYIHGILNTASIVAVIAVAPAKLIQEGAKSRYWWLSLDLLSFLVPF